MFRRKEPAEDDAIAVKRPIELDGETLEKFNTITEMCEEVYCGMRKGFAENVYEEALCIELQIRNIQYTRQETIPCTYKDRFVGNIRLDVLLHSWLPFVFELKATSSGIQTDERWQLVRYMSRKGVPYGAVVNFHQGITKGLEISFVVEQPDGYFIYDPATREGKRLRDA
jgi:GxxExxY protein